jgi:hypothetical protein
MRHSRGKSMGILVKTCFKSSAALAILASALFPPWMGKAGAAEAPPAASPAADAPKVEFEEFDIRMAVEFGHLINGGYQTAGHKATLIENQALNRNIVFLTQNIRFEDAWEVSAGLMGVLWWPYTPEPGPPGSRNVRVEPRLSVLKGRWNFGAQESRSFLEFGYFPYKYNRDAWNLGEYLHRSGTYPGNVVTSDGYQFMDHAAYDAYGAHARFSSFSGMVLHDLTLFSEPSVDPIGDLTPAYEISFNLPLVQLGAGAAYYRGFSYQPSQTRPDEEANRYIEVTADPVSGRAYYKGPWEGAPIGIREDTTKPYRLLSRWNHQGVKLMARAAVDLGGLIPEHMRSPEDLRVYAEAAVLGVEDQPYYYEKIAQRIPIMLGVNVPTFGLLDLLALQAEYYDNPFNDTYNYNILSLPVWKVANYQTKDADSYENSPWKWSLHGRKSLNRLLDLHVQVASDHLRLRDALSTPSEYELTLKPKNWYYLVRMEMGI